MKIMIMTDLEGVAGVLNREDWTVPSGRYHEKAKRLLTEEVNAAVDGMCQGGATEVLVVDGHGPGGIDPELLDARAELMRGAPQPVWPWGLDCSFSALAFVGQHAKAGTPYSHLSHTQGFHFMDLSVNGVSIGEFGQLALCAKELGIPTIFASGEAALAEESQALCPGIVTVPVKRGLLPDGLDDLSMEDYQRAKLSAVHLAPKAARELIREGALNSVRQLQGGNAPFGYVALEPPFTRIAAFRNTGHSHAYVSRDTHPTSFIELMNMGYTPETGKA